MPEWLCEIMADIKLRGTDEVPYWDLARDVFYRTNEYQASSDTLDLVARLIAEVERLRKVKEQLRIAALEQAVEIYRRSSVQCHTGHWDRKGTHGANCPECLRARNLREQADKILEGIAEVERLRKEQANDYSRMDKQDRRSGAVE